MFAAVLFTAEKDDTSPTPFAAKPIAGLLFVQEKTVPVLVLVTGTMGEIAPLHTLLLEMGVTVGSAKTVMVKFAPLPVQPFKVGTTVMAALIGKAIVFVVENAGRSPLPLAPSPTE